MLFRKFYYENSSYFDEETVFAEVSNKTLALQALGLSSDEEVLAVMNVNAYTSFGPEMKVKEHQFLNLPLQAVSFQAASLNQLHSRYLQAENPKNKSVQPEQLKEWVLNSDEVFSDLFKQTQSFIEQSLTGSSKVYAQTP